MVTQERQITTKDLITPHDLLQKALELKGLTGGQIYNEHSRASGPIATYPFNKELKTFLAQEEFRIEQISGLYFYLVNGQSHRDSGGRWYIATSKTTPLIDLITILQISHKDRGIFIQPDIRGSFSSYSEHQPSINRLFQVLTEHDPNPSDLAKTIIENKGKLLITWRELEVSGIRTIQELFDESFKGGELVNRISRTYLSPFNPPIHSEEYRQHPENKFVLEELQPTLLRQWRRQLEDFKSQLV